MNEKITDPGLILLVRNIDAMAEIIADLASAVGVLTNGFNHSAREAADAIQAEAVDIRRKLKELMP